MTNTEIGEAVTREYGKQHPDWTSVRVTEVVLDTFGGNLVVTRSKTETQVENEEICFVYPEGTVRIFYTTEELARFLEQKAKAPMLERLFTRPVLSGAIFAFLLIAIFVTGFLSTFRPEALSILGSVVGVAAGFFFGTRQTA